MPVAASLNERGLPSWLLLRLEKKRVATYSRLPKPEKMLDLQTSLEEIRLWLKKEGEVNVVHRRLDQVRFELGPGRRDPITEASPISISRKRT